jgi:hypothetical protein
MVMRYPRIGLSWVMKPARAVGEGVAVTDATLLVAVGVAAAVTAGLGEVVAAGALQANVRKKAAIKIVAVDFIVTRPRSGYAKAREAARTRPAT